ncbi:MAG: serine/threonine-protein kinase [Desulfobacterales bacterium]|nr:serine/threonine-protein kinase [Desulfobacterales bacterium]
MQTTGRYEILSKLGQGAAGVVYLAWDPVIRRKVALKVSQAATAEFKDNFLYEAESAGRLNHPNVVAVYDAGAENDHCYIAMEFINGTTLESHCLKETLLPQSRALEIVLDICKGLDYAHREGVIHRDIKPSNILLNAEGAAKITGRFVASEGQIDDTLYIILSGRAKVLKGGMEIATIERGECFGEIALLGGKPRVANVQADTDCILMKITANLLQQLPEAIGFLFFRNFARILVRRLSPP